MNIYLVMEDTYDNAPPLGVYRSYASALERCLAEAEIAAKEATKATRRNYKQELDYYAREIAIWGGDHVPVKTMTCSTASYQLKPDPWDSMTLKQRLARIKKRGVKKVKVVQDEDGWGTDHGDRWYVEPSVLI